MRHARWSASVVALAFLAVGCSSSPPPDPPVDARFGTGDFALAPMPAWSLDAAALGTVTHGLQFSLPSIPGDDAPMLVGLGDGDYSKNPRGLRVMALDPNSGERLWLRDIGPIRQCAEEIDDHVLACYGDHRVVYIDVADGRILGDISTDFYVYHVRAANGVGYVSGRSEDMLVSDVYSGSFTELDTHWHKTFDSPTPGQPASPAVLPDRDIVDVYSAGAHLIADIFTGDPRFRFAGENPLPLGNDLYVNVTRSPEGSLTEEVLDGTGKTLTVVAVPTSGLSPVPWPNLGDDDLPKFLGDGAYDPRTGAELWRNPDTGDQRRPQLCCTGCRGPHRRRAFVRNQDVLGHRHRVRKDNMDNPVAGRVLGKIGSNGRGALRVRGLHRHACAPRIRRPDDVVGPVARGCRPSGDVGVEQCRRTGRVRSRRVDHLGPDYDVMPVISVGSGT
ncbi:hypothetical protein QMK17_02705 [Rhodococcus sp. G-MC3]|nr:hypothetical protein [Rhodococcus sp. G-MC3]MDJ0392241.1 hypothetical protein [Rhodococcus sp. G-MC3]